MTAPAQQSVPIIAIVGWKNSGKTTLTVRLVEEFVRRGVRVATIKHAHHGFAIDEGNTDSARHRAAGARQVAVVSPKRWALITELEDLAEPDLNDVISWLAPCDLVIVEGYKSHPIPKIEARRASTHQEGTIADHDMMVLAIASDYPIDDHHRPVFDLNDVVAIADFVDTTIGPIERTLVPRQFTTSKTGELTS